MHRVLADAALGRAAASHGHASVREAVRTTLAAARRRVAAGAQVPTVTDIVGDTMALLAAAAAPGYPEVINATGVLIHTNLGRAPCLAPALPAYLALEYDLDAGARGERLAPVVERLTRYFGCEAATVVTNNAAALVLLLAAHAAGREVVVSRGELIEIGGSFRLPEIMTAAGATLVEVGCTNRTHAPDYERAISESTGGILVVHRSNFHMDGFVTSPPLAELAALARRRGVPLWVDQGSGCHLDLTRYGLRSEPTVRELLAAGADAVLFSGDKLLGAPQAGIIAGSAAAVAPLRRHPLRRALRLDKAALVGLAATLDAYLAEQAEQVPLYRLLAVTAVELRRRALRLARALRTAGAATRVVATRSVLGGGTTPDQALASWAVALPGGDELARRLRRAAPPIISRVENADVLLDLRAVFQEQDRTLRAAVLAALGTA